MQQPQRSSGSDRFELGFGHSEVPKSILSLRVGFVVDDQPITPPHNLGKRHVYLGAALPSPTVAHHEGERVVTQIKIRFGLNLKLLPPRIIYFREVPSQPVVTAVLAATYGSEQGMELNLPIAQRDRSFYIPRA